MILLTQLMWGSSIDAGGHDNDDNDDGGADDVCGSSLCHTPLKFSSL